jgi:hypothetical protein
MPSRRPSRLIVLATLLLGGCSDKVTVPPASNRVESMVAVARSAPAQSASNAPTNASLAAYWSAQKLIRSAELRVQVADVQAAVRRADSVATQRGALLADSRVTQGKDEAREAQVVIRVPSDRFAETLAALRRIGEVKSEAVKTQDITKEYADLETRLSVKEQTVARLRQLLSDRTAKLSDVLQVETQLANTVTELEQLKGERRYFDQQVAISTISVTFAERASSRAVQLTGPIAEAFRSSLDVLGRSFSALIYVVAFLLPWLVVAGIVWWVATRVRTRFERPRKVLNAVPTRPSES